MPNILGNFGLEMEGLDAARGVRQNYDMGNVNIEGAKQGNQLRSQQVQAGQMGLEDVQRTHATDAAVRAAGAAGSFEDMAKAAQAAGDLNRATQYREQARNMEDEGMKNVVHKALINSTPGKRPDLGSEFNRFGTLKVDPNSVELDDKGNMTYVDQKTGLSNTINLGMTAERLGLVKPFEHVLPAGSTYLRGTPGGATTTYTAPPAARTAATRTGTIYDVPTGKVLFQPPDESWTLGKVQNGENEIPVSFNKKTGEAVVLGPGGNTEKATVHTDNAGNVMATIGNKIFKVIPGQEGSPAETNIFSPNKPAVPGTPPTLQEVAPPAAPPAGAPPGTKPAADGKFYAPDPTRPGKFVEVVPQGAVTTKPPTAPTPAAPVAAPVVAEAPKPKSGGSGSRNGTKPAVKTGGRNYDMELEKTDKKLKMLGNSVRLGSADPNVDAQQWLAYVARAKELKSKNFAKGGKVQRYGLNA